MLKKLLIFSSILAISSVIQADELKNNKLYIDIGVGLNSANDRKNPDVKCKRIGNKSFRSLTSLGYKINNNISIQAGMEYYFNNEYTQECYTKENGAFVKGTTIKMKIFAPKVSMIFNHSLNKNFDFYFGPGIGAAMFSSMATEVDGKTVKNHYNKNNFYWSIDTGMIIHLNDNIDMSFGYNYGNFGKTGKPWDPIIMNTIKTSLRFNF